MNARGAESRQHAEQQSCKERDRERECQQAEIKRDIKGNGFTAT